jgi:pimeloyl-ACP methyl ester carboxylesterase
MGTSGSGGQIISHGYKIDYVRWGEKRPNVVIVHSMGMDAHSMDILAEKLTDSCRILSLTILGHGDSDVPSKAPSLSEHAEIMRDCYTRLGFKPNILIGHSIGGMMGMILAAEHGEEFKGLALVDIAPFESTNRPSRPPSPESFADEDAAMVYLRERYPSFAEAYYGNRLLHAFVRNKDGTLRLKPTGDSIRSTLATDLWPYAEKIRVPTLLIIGSNSDLVKPEAVERLRRHIPRLEALEVMGASHMVPQDKPEEFETIVRGFIQKYG